MPNEQALKCIEEIRSVIEKYNFVFTESKAIRKNLTVKDRDYLKIVKRMLGILSNANENNAELKIKNIIKFVNAL